MGNGVRTVTKGLVSPDKIVPLTTLQSTPLTGVRHFPRRYVLADEIAKLAIQKYEKNGRGLIFADLLKTGLAPHKIHAQNMLKYQRRKGTLFKIGDKRPQQYYATAIKARVIEGKTRQSTPLDPTGAGLISDSFMAKSPLSSCLKHLAIQTLEGYVLPLLPEAPLSIHNLHFWTRISRDIYSELKLKTYSRNGGKYWTETIGASRVDYIIYSNGTVDIQAGCSDEPFRVETETDRSRLLTYFGQIKDRLIGFLRDPHERIVPDIMEWNMTECDVNKDVKITELLQFNAIKIQVKHLDHLLSVYIKSRGKDTYCRVEERMHFASKSAFEVILDTLNPSHKVERLEGKIDLLIAELKTLEAKTVRGPCNKTNLFPTREVAQQ
jgi:hypothetical protein